MTELEAEAPISPRGVWKRVSWEGRDAFFLCGTLGTGFDLWQRRLSAVSAADAWYAQQIGLIHVEREMDALEGEIRKTLAQNETLLPRRSPGYGEMPLSLSREILDQLDATRRLGVTMTDSLLLVPSKSVTAICLVAKA